MADGGMNGGMNGGMMNGGARAAAAAKEPKMSESSRVERVDVSQPPVRTGANLPRRERANILCFSSVTSRVSFPSSTRFIFIHS